MTVEIKNRWNDKIILCGEYENIKDCLRKNRGADLGGADLGGADLRGADLGGAYLRGAENYSESHDFFMQIVDRQKIDYFTIEQWSIIGKICIKKLCWDTIKSKFGKKAITIFKKMTKVGFNEWEERYKALIKEQL